jgi:flagellar biosynthesis component FlhA
MPDETIEPKRPIKDSFVIIGGVLMVILVLFINFPVLLLDILWGLDLILILLILLVVLHSKKANDFSLLPSCLLILTIFSLGIQISFVRHILTNGEAFYDWIIRFLSSIMMLPGGIIGLIMGVIIFIIFTIAVTLIVTKACTRISVVAVRFIQNSLPCKQMVIDAEYVYGTITGEEAIAKKNVFQCESDFYGAIDGVGKFISGYLKACLFITALSIIGGMIIGILLKGEPIYSTMMTYIPLSICNGFLAQFLCLMESIIVGIVATKAVKTNNFDKEPCSPPDLIRIELGFNLIPLVEKSRGTEFLLLLKKTRHELIEELEIEIPKIRIVDNILLEVNDYRILIKEKEAGRWMLKPDYFLCIYTGGVTKELPGEKVCEPVSSLPAIWVNADQREEAERLGYTVADPEAVIVSHLKEIIKHRVEEFQED